MSEISSRKELHTYDADALVNLVITLQHQLNDEEEQNGELKQEIRELKEQLKDLNDKMQLIVEQLAAANRRRFGRPGGKGVQMDGQISLADIDGAFQVFNEAEGYFDEKGDLPADYDEDAYASPPKKRKKKASQYPRKADIDLLPRIETRSALTEQQLKEFFGDEKYKRLPDQIQYSYQFVPASLMINEHHIEVYAGKDSERVIKAGHPKKLLRNSLVSPNMAAAVYTAKYKSAIPSGGRRKSLRIWAGMCPRRTCRTGSYSCRKDTSRPCGIIRRNSC